MADIRFDQMNVDHSLLTVPKKNFLNFKEDNIKDIVKARQKQRNTVFSTTKTVSLSLDNNRLRRKREITP
jgi:hypothetical protein